MKMRRTGATDTARVLRVVSVALAISATTAGTGLLAWAAQADPLKNHPEEGQVPHVEEDVPVTALHQSLGVANNSPALDADPTEPDFVVLANRLDAPDFRCALQVSGDGGGGWLTVNPVPELPVGADKCYAPEAAFDRNGVLYYLFVGLEGAGNEPIGVFLATSDDRGRTFSRPRPVLGPLNFGVRMAIDTSMGEAGRIHLVWLHATSDPPLGGFGPPPNPILAAYSDDAGETFSTPVQVNDPDHELAVAAALELGPDHAVHVVYYDLQDDVRDYRGLEGDTWDGTWSLVSSTSDDGGVHFGPAVTVDDSIAPPDRVMLIFTMPPPAVAAGEERVCIGWTDARYGDADALLRCSNDRGRTWSELHRLNDDAKGNGHTQYMPQLSIGPNGRIDAIFYDRRDDAEDVFNHVYYSFSADGGGQFARNLRLTTEPSYSRIGQEYLNVSAEGQFEFGSRLALLSTESAALAAWTDTRNSRSGGTGQDIFAARVVMPSDNGRSGAPAVGGVVLLASGVSGFVLFRRIGRGKAKAMAGPRGG